MNLIALTIPTLGGDGGGIGEEGVDEGGVDVGEVGDGVDGGGNSRMRRFINQTILLVEDLGRSSSLSHEIRGLFSNPSIPWYPLPLRVTPNINGFA